MPLINFPVRRLRRFGDITQADCDRQGNIFWNVAARGKTCQTLLRGIQKGGGYPSFKVQNKTKNNHEQTSRPHPKLRD